MGVFTIGWWECDGVWWSYNKPLVEIEGNLPARRCIDEVLEPGYSAVFFSKSR